MKTTAEVIIIGGGVNGCAAAYYLAKDGVDVIVLEGSDYIGNGGSSRNCGGVRQSGRDPRELPYVMWGIKELWPNLSEELGADVEYFQEGNLRLGKNEAHYNKLKSLADKASAVGLEVTMISGDEVREINPYLSDEVVCASWCPTDGHANPLRTTLAYFRRARQLGVHFYTGARVAKLRTVKGEIRKVVLTDGTVFEAPTVIVAAAYQSREILNTVGLDVPMQMKNVESLVTEAQPPMFWQMLGTATADFYGHQTPHGSFVLGGSAGYDFCNPMNQDGIGVPKSSSIYASYLARAVLGFMPALKDAKIVRTWAGWTDVCSDGVPVISPAEEIPGLIIACGFSGHGFGSAPAVGVILSEMAQGKELSVNMDALHYDRFAAKDRKH